MSAAGLSPTPHYLPFNIRPYHIPNTGDCRAPEVPYDTVMTIASLMYMAFSIVYSVFGYRCFRSSTFLTGFTFATFIVYLICVQENVLPHIGNVTVAVFGGLLFGLINMLIQYVGLFMSGLHTGFLLAVGQLAIYDYFITEYPTTYWLSIAAMMGTAILFSILNLYWKKGLTIFGTAVYGGAMLAITLDFFFERLETLIWLWDRAKLERYTPAPCQYSWMFLAIWPVTAFIGLLIQSLITSKGTHHEESVIAQKRRLQHQQSRPITKEQRDEMKQKKYRYLYQVRTAHGDVISQSYVQALQNKAHLNSNWSGSGAGECSTLQSDATHLTVLPGSEQHDSDDDMNQIRPAR